MAHGRNTGCGPGRLAMGVTERILSALITVIRMNDQVEAMAGLMKEPQRRLNDLQGRVIRLDTDGDPTNA